MQILQSGTKLKKFNLYQCGVSNLEMKELIDLMKQTPILPNIASISWCDNGGDWNSSLHKELLKTIEDKFPHAM
jgi:hypothetical protein